jgi:putative peptide zinc metalloprotease protein
MTTDRDYSIRELGQARLTLRGDLIFSPQSFGGLGCYVVEDPLNSKFYRIGAAEYAFISLLDGRTSVADAMQMTASASPGGGLSEQDAAAICKWLVDAELASTTESASPERLASAANKSARGRLWQQWNPIVVRLPMLRPDRFLERMTPQMSWLYTVPAFVVWSIVLLLAAYQVAANWSRFAASSEGVLAPGNWLWLGACWIVLKCVHELSHGVVCKKYGGTVREAGVMLIVLAPIAYVDVTSSWRFRSKWQRIFTAAAGMYVELFIAAVAALVWARTDSGVINHLCFNAMLMASLTTILFNANPLMRFDGYYILSDWLEIPNLYSAGQQFLRDLARRHVLGIRGASPAGSPTRRMFIRVYAVAALVWRVIVCAGLFVVAVTLLHGAGIVLAAFAVVAWAVVPVARFVYQLWCGKSWERPNWFWFSTAVALAASLLLALFVVIPWPGASRAPAVVEYSPLTIVRAGTAGFVSEVHVRGGQFVEQGQVLAVLRNEQLEFELADLQLALQQSQLLSRVAEQKQKLAEQQAEQEKAEALKKRIEERQQQVNRLLVRAPRSGKIIGRDLDTLSGAYLKDGAQILAIGNEAQKELQISVAQDDLDAFTTRVGQTVYVRLPGSGRLECRLAKLEPRAKLEPSHASLCAPAGGPLVVRKKEAAADASQDPSQQYEFVAPRFTGTLELAAAQAGDLHAGQLASVSFRSYHETFGLHLFNAAVKWMRDRIRAQRTE